MQISRCKSLDANLSRINLSGADLSNSIIINTIYENLKVNKDTNFTDAIIDDPNFIDYIKQFTNKVPNKIENKKDLKNKLEKRTDYHVHTDYHEYINDLLKSSKLID